MIKEIQAKTILGTNKDPDAWFGVRYNMNIYRGCEHRCIYCDSRSSCYQIENFDDVLVKINALELLEKELSSKRIIGTVGTGSMSDPYTHAETGYNMTGRALEIIAAHKFPVHINTKSDLILRDMDILKTISNVRASVSFTVTTIDDKLSAMLEPGAPVSSRRFQAMRMFADAGIYTGVLMMPLLPFVEDNLENITAIVEQTRNCGGRYVIPGFGMSMRDRQRAYYYNKLNKLFPGLSSKYMKTYKDNYICPSPKEKELKEVFQQLCKDYGLLTDTRQLELEMKPYSNVKSNSQIKLF